MTIENFLATMNSEMIGFAQSLIKINSAYGNETDVCKLIQERLARYGIKGKLIGKDKNRISLAVHIKGKSSKKKLMFAGHTDTVAFGDISKWKCKPLSGRLVGDKIYGRGAYDMKCGVAAMVYTAVALHKFHEELNGDVIFIFAAGEEGGLHIGAKDAMDSGIRADACVVCEPMHDYDLRIGSRGVYRFEITTIGRSGHTGLSSSKGINAVAKMAKVLIALQKTRFNYTRMKGFPEPKITLGTLIKGGVGINMYPPECNMAVDCRLSHGQTLKSAKEDVIKVLEMLKKGDAELKYKIKDLSFTPPAYTSKNHPIVKICLKNIEKIYHKINGTKISGGATDGNIISLYGIPHVIFGVRGGNAHAENEFAYASSILKTAKAYSSVALEFLK